MVQNGTITITGYNPAAGLNVIIPATINGTNVTSIGNNAFFLGSSLTNVTIPNSVTNIGTAAFDNCSGLTSVTIGTNVTSIGTYAFYNCTKLTSVTIPNSVISIGDAAFYECTSLTSVTIGNSVTSIGYYAFSYCNSLTSVTIPNSVNNIDNGAFYNCSSLTNLTIPNSVTNINPFAFGYCTNLTSVTIGNGVFNIGSGTFAGCSSLTSITIPNSVTNIGQCCTFQDCQSLTSVTIGTNVTSIGVEAFIGCGSLTSVTIPNGVTSIDDGAFRRCPSLTGVYFWGNAPSLGGSAVFYPDYNATVYYLPGTRGWGATYGGLPTAVWWIPPAIQGSPQTQTAEAGSAVGLRVKASGPFLFCLWYFNYTNLIICSTNCELELTNVQFSQAGAYSVVVSNALGVATSAPAMLNVIGAVERRPVPGVQVMGEAGGLLNLNYTDSLSPAPNWTTLGSVSLTSTAEYYFDLTLPLPPQRFYRAWQTGAPGVMPSLDLHLVPAITLTGDIGHALRLDYINQVGPIDAWVTLDTVTLTNTSQLYFDVSAVKQPQRLYRLLPGP
jgi:hypothetical protein